MPHTGSGSDPTVSPTSPKQGDTVTVTAKPASGKNTVSCTAVDANGNNLTVTKVSTNVYTFVQVDSIVKVQVAYSGIVMGS